MWQKSILASCSHFRSRFRISRFRGIDSLWCSTASSSTGTYKDIRTSQDHGKAPLPEVPRRAFVSLFDADLEGLRLEAWSACCAGVSCNCLLTAFHTPPAGTLDELEEPTYAVGEKLCITWHTGLSRRGFGISWLFLLFPFCNTFSATPTCLFSIIDSEQNTWNWYYLLCRFLWSRLFFFETLSCFVSTPFCSSLLWIIKMSLTPWFRTNFLALRARFFRICSNRGVVFGGRPYQSISVRLLTEKIWYQQLDFHIVRNPKMKSYFLKLLSLLQLDFGTRKGFNRLIQLVNKF